MGGVSNESAPPYSRAITLGTIQNRLSITESKISSLETFCLPPRRGMQSYEAPLMCVPRCIDAPPWLQESPSTSATQQFPWYFLFAFWSKPNQLNVSIAKSPILKCYMVELERSTWCRATVSLHCSGCSNDRNVTLTWDNINEWMMCFLHFSMLEKAEGVGTAPHLIDRLGEGESFLLLILLTFYSGNCFFFLLPKLISNIFP